METMEVPFVDQKTITETLFFTELFFHFFSSNLGFSFTKIRKSQDSKRRGKPFL